MKKAFKLFGLLLLALAVWMLLQPAAPGLAQGSGDEPTADEVNSIAKQLYCPVCENIPLDVCGTVACEQWRGLIREKLVAGWSENQIKQYFVDQYGDRVLATPPARGLNWLVYVVPPLAILAGAYLLFRAIQGWRQPPPAAAEELSQQLPDDEYIRKLEEELKKQ